MPSALGGSFFHVSTSASRLILRRKAILPSVLNPTTWKTSLPMSMPIEAKGSMVVSMGCSARWLDVTSGPSYGEAIVSCKGGSLLYHASLDAAEYRALLNVNGSDRI